MCMNYTVHVSSIMWRIENQSSDSTSCSDNALRLLILVADRFTLRTSSDVFISNLELHLEGLFLREVYFEGPSRVWRALKTSILKTGPSQHEPGNELWSLLGKELGGILRPPPSQLPHDSPFVQVDFLLSSTCRFFTGSPTQVAPAALLQMSTWNPGAAGYKRVAGSLLVTKLQTFLSESYFPATCVSIL